MFSSVSSAISYSKMVKGPYLDLSFCDLRFEIPTELFECQWLKGIVLGRFEGDRGSDPNWVYHLVRGNRGKKNLFKGHELSCLSRLPNLEELFLYDVGVESLSFLGSLPSLRKLYLIKSHLSSLASLPPHSRLQLLEIEEGQVKNIGDSLAGLTSLGELKLRNNKIADITVLGDLKTVEKLYLSGNQISDISVLSGLTQLKQLELSGNQVSNIDPLLSLVNLERLNIGYNRIEYFDTRVLERFPRLKEIVIRGNPFKVSKEEEIEWVERYISKRDPEVRARDNEQAFTTARGVFLFLLVTGGGSLIGGAAADGKFAGYVVGLFFGPMIFFFLFAMVFRSPKRRKY
ncbi:MAG TPA: leucine-rich repeat domain-containing protein [Puia sp.]|nr:leucine-rich repeat domain-containing protein [Puia sp.]